MSIADLDYSPHYIPFCFPPDPPSPKTFVARLICSAGLNQAHSISAWNGEIARRYACDCAERALDAGKVTDKRAHNLIAVARRFADREATRDEMDSVLAIGMEAVPDYKRSYDSLLWARGMAWWSACGTCGDHVGEPAKCAVKAVGFSAPDVADFCDDAFYEACYEERVWQHDRLFQYLYGDILARIEANPPAEKQATDA